MLKPEPGFDGQAVIPVGATMLALSTLAVILRFISRWITKVNFWWDDWIILAALPFSWFMCISDIEGVLNEGDGSHIAYCVGVTLPKFSVLALYWRVFGLESFRWPLIITAIVTGMYFIAVTLVAIFSCVPVEGFWDRTIPATCLNMLNFYIGQAVATILIDIVLLLLPIIPIRRLNISASQKVAVVGIFGLGIFVTICSAVRLHALVVTTIDPKASLDISYTFVPASVWSYTETNLSVVCACLPSMRPLLRVLVHGRIWSSGQPYCSPRPGYGESAGSANRNSAYGGRTGTHGSSAPAERARRWHRQNTLKNSRISSDTPRRAGFQLTKLGAAVSVIASSSNDNDRDAWHELTDLEKSVDEPAAAAFKHSPSLSRTIEESEDRVRRFLHRKPPAEVEVDKSARRSNRQSAQDGDGPAMRLDEYEIHSERVGPTGALGRRNSSEPGFGYRYEITGGLGTTEEEEASRRSRSHSSDESSGGANERSKVWDWGRKGST